MKKVNQPNFGAPSTSGLAFETKQEKAPKVVAVAVDVDDVETEVKKADSKKAFKKKKFN